MEELDMLSLEKRRLSGDMIVVFKYLKCCHKEDQKRLFSFATEGKTQGTGFKLQQSRFILGHRKSFLAVRTLG